MGALLGSRATLLFVTTLLVTTAFVGCIGSEDDGDDGGIVGPGEAHRPSQAALESAQPFSLFLCKDGFRTESAINATTADGETILDRCNHRVSKPMVSPDQTDPQDPERPDVRTQHGPGNEVSIAVNPADPLTAAGGAKDYTVSYVSDHAECGEYTVWMGTFATDDGGLTWSNDLMRGFPGDTRESPLSGNQCNTDPVLVWDDNGTLWYSGLNYVGQRESMSTAESPLGGSDAYTGSQLYFARSDDGGHNYSAINFAAGGDSTTVFNDKQWFALQPDGDHMIATWAQFIIAPGPLPVGTDVIMFTESLDGGQTWTQPSPLRPGGDQNDPTSGPAIPAAGQFSMPQYLPGAAEDDAVPDLAAIWWNGTHVLYSQGTMTPGGTEFGPVQSTFPVNSLASEEGRDGTGPTEYRLSTYPVLAVDPGTEACDGRRYVIWADQPGEVNTDVDVLLRYSQQGDTWSDPVRVNDDETGDQLMPWIDVDPRGGVHAVWYDKRGDPDNVKMDVYYAYSPDCGETWMDNVRVTEAHFDGDKAHHQNGRPFIGDYIGVDTTEQSAHVIWADTRHTGEEGREAGSDVYSATILRGAGAFGTFEEAFQAAQIE